MERLSTEEINHIKNSVDIVDIVSKYMPLNKTGKNYFGVCPFHEDSDPSLSVSQDKQIFSCFSCHTAGNVFNFVMEFENIPFMQAVKIIAATAGINVQVNDNKPIYNGNLYEIYELAQKFYLNNINTTIAIKAKEYLYSRQLNDDIIKEFKIGLSLKSTDKLSNLFLKKEFKEKDIITSGLIVKNEKGYHDFFYDRILFPLADANNQIVAYSGRIYDGEGPKYVNSKEHPLFKKSNFLYNYYRAKDDCRSKSTVIIMEGFLDVIRAYSIGIKNVVATMGTAFTKEHASLIKRLANNVIICYDGDSAGNKATLACANELINAGIIPKIVRLEENLDPDDYILKKGKEKFVQKLENSMTVMDFKLLFFKQNNDINKIEDQAKYVSTILNELNKIDDDILKEITLKKLSLETALDFDFLKAKLNKKIPKIKIKKEIVKTNKYEIAELGLLFYMMRFTDVIKMYDKQLFYFPDKDYRLLAKELSLFHKEKGYINIAELIISLDDALIKVIGQAEALNLNEEYTNELINDYIRAIKEINTTEECERITKKIGEEQDETKKAEIAQKIVELLMRRENDV